MSADDLALRARRPGASSLALARAVRGGAKGRARRFARATGPPLLFVALALGAWALIAGTSDSPLIPGLSEIWASLKDIVQHGDALGQIGVSVQRVVLGFALAFVVAIGVGIAMGRNALVRDVLEPAILLGLTIPGLVWALLCVIWFGVALTTPVLAIALSAAPALVLNVVQGVRAVDPGLIEMAHVFDFNRRTRLTRLWLPAIAPYLLSGARLGLSLGWKVLVLVEMFGMSSGVGYQLQQSFSAQDVSAVIAWTLLFSVAMAILEYGVLAVIERRVTRWRRVVSV
ncbi:MAG TPA: ABC transporter permease [Baekduia sp.]|nr:ABC transporter permease [Baekduia sp.]